MVTVGTSENSTKTPRNLTMSILPACRLAIRRDILLPHDARRKVKTSGFGLDSGGGSAVHSGDLPPRKDIFMSAGLHLVAIVSLVVLTGCAGGPPYVWVCTPANYDIGNN